MPRTLAEKVWERHVVHRAEGEPDLLYVDLHLVHEVTSAQAFEGLRVDGRRVRRPYLTVATMSVKLREPCSTASRIATHRSSTPTPVEGTWIVPGLRRIGAGMLTFRIMVPSSRCWNNREWGGRSGQRRDTTVVSASAAGSRGVNTRSATDAADACREGLGTPCRPSG